MRSIISRVTPDHFRNAVEVFAKDGSVNTVPLYLHLASLVQLPSKCSRHNTPTQAHALTKAVLKNSSGNDEAFVVSACLSILISSRTSSWFHIRWNSSFRSDRVLDEPPTVVAAYKEAKLIDPIRLFSTDCLRETGCLRQRLRHRSCFPSVQQKVWGLCFWGRRETTEV